MLSILESSNRGFPFSLFSTIGAGQILEDLDIGCVVVELTDNDAFEMIKNGICFSDYSENMHNIAKYVLFIYLFTFERSKKERKKS